MFSLLNACHYCAHTARATGRVHAAVIASSFNCLFWAFAVVFILNSARFVIYSLKWKEGMEVQILQFHEEGAKCYGGI